MARKPGRPNLYVEKVEPRLSEIGEWAKSGASNKEIASGLGVGYSNFSSYIGKYPELAKVLEEGRRTGISEVRMALYKRAVGYEYEEKKTYMKKDEEGNTQQYTELTKKYQSPDTSAINMYLRNYDPEWSDKDFWSRQMKEMEMELRQKSLEFDHF